MEGFERCGAVEGVYLGPCLPWRDPLAADMGRPEGRLRVSLWCILIDDHDCSEICDMEPGM